MSFIILSIIILISSITYLFAIKNTNQTLIYILKPGTMLVIVILALTGTNTPYAWWVIIGLLFSVIGDIFLMVPSDRFLQGLLSFLVAHVCYIIAFLYIPHQPEKMSVFFTVCLVAVGLLFFYHLVKGIRVKGGYPLMAAVFFYMVLITSMVWFSVLTESSLIIAAAFLFYLSDATLAWDRFIKPIKFRNYIVMSTYFLAQYLFSVTIHIVNFS